MSQINSVTINDTTYNIAQAPAPEQKSLMLMLGGKIAFNSNAADADIDVKLLVGALMTLPEETFDKVQRITLAKCVKSGETTPLDDKSFQGKMMELFTLVAEAVYHNLNDFFTWLDAERAERRASNQSNATS